MAKTSLTAGELLDIIVRSRCVIEVTDGADEHAELLGELRAAERLIQAEIGASHMGTGADIVLIEAGDGTNEDDKDDDDDDGERDECGGCGQSYNATESDANDPDTYCSASCESEDQGGDE